MSDYDPDAETKKAKLFLFVVLPLVIAFGLCWEIFLRSRGP